MGLERGNRSRKRSKSNANVNVNDGNGASNVDVVEKNPKRSVLFGSNEYLEKTAPAKDSKKSELNSNASPPPAAAAVNESSSSTSPPDDVLPLAGKNCKEPRRSSSSLPALKDEKKGNSQHHESSKSRGSENSSIGQSITFPVPDFIPESYHLHVASMMQSPPMQVMERSRGGGGGEEYDPCRIPSAIFETNKTKPVEWSNASNESLFSLQLGTSFSRDRLLSMEFSKPGEVEFQFSPSPSVPVADAENRISVVKWPSIPMEETREETNETKKSESCVADGTTSKDATMPDVVEDTSERNKKTLTVEWKSKKSDESEESNHPLAFPVLEAGVKTNPKGFAKSQPLQPPHLPESTPTSKAIMKSTSGSCFHCFSCCSWSCSSCHSCNCSSYHSCSCSSCHPCNCSSCRPSCCSNCHPCSCSSCHTCSCSSCHPCSCSSCHPCGCSCNPCFSTSCCPCLCSSCCPCRSCSFHPFSCTSCDPRNCTSCHPRRSCSSCFRRCSSCFCCCCGSCNRCCRCC
ncbi:hypothetical protein P3X46_034946 [Hevea brasiliensis]|uniref:Uncharacterized protein n=1 Tax=Hevea brasiliensis TaxID=3981 RepID=A0ABQ9K8E9_HEVBR|nr:hypothetical protein P3X46_034946 [Hevea brasiliensis]